MGSVRGYCATVHAKRRDSNDLAWVPADNREEVWRLLEAAERAANRWDVGRTDFLTPAVASDVLACLQGRSDVVAVPWGGYATAERVRLLLGREEVMEGVKVDPSTSEAVVALQVKGNFMFDPAKHPDFLGAVLGTGVVRGKVGDIIVQGESGAQILVDPDLSDHFEMALTQVRSVPVETMSISLDQLNVRAPKVEEFNSFEASMRLDALASAGFRMPRSKMAGLVKSGDARVNWRPAGKPSADLKEGDVVAVTGRGRVEIKAVSRTKKDRFNVTFRRYL